MTLANRCFFETKRKCSLLHQNIAGVLNKKDLLETSLIELEKSGMNIDIICLCETFIKKGAEANLILKNYKLVSAYSRPHQRRGGTCILVKKNLDCKPITNLIEPKLCYFECCGIEITTLKLYVICIYRTPNSNVTLFLENLNLLLKNLLKRKNKTAILCGDWNLDVIKADKNVKELESILKNFNINNHITKPTRKLSCIDLIVSNIANVTPQIHYLALSDHETGQTISFDINVDTKCMKKTFWFERRRDFNQDNISKFINCLSSLSFSEIYETEDTDTAFNYFHDILTLFYNLCFPLKKVKITVKPIKHKWMTKGIKKCCVNKRRLYLKYRLSTANKHQHKNAYNNSKTMYATSPKSGEHSLSVPI